MAQIQAEKENVPMVPVNLPEDVLQELKWLSEQLGTTPSEALRQAIASESYIQKKTQNGEQVTFKPKRRHWIVA